MRRAAWLVALSVAACGGGSEIMIDATPHVLIPNGGSAQAGQVEGPTAIPITGEGAIHPAPVVEAPVEAPAAPPLSVMDQAAIEATAGNASHADEADDDDGGDDAGHDEPAAREDDEPAEPVVAAPAARVKPAAAEAVATVALRTIQGDGYAFAIPAAWEDLDPGGLGSFLITSANRSMNAGDGFYTNVIVSAESFPADTTSYATLNVPALLDAGAVLRDATTVAPTKTQRGRVDVEAYWINVTGVPYVTVQRYVTTGAVGYVITCAAAASAFEDERDTCLDILDSFRLE